MFSCVNIISYGIEDESCKYLTQTSTYSHPPKLNSEFSSSTAKYQPVAVRDSWCLPTYVSYTGSLEWSSQVHARSKSGIISDGGGAMSHPVSTESVNASITYSDETAEI